MGGAESKAGDSKHEVHFSEDERRIVSSVFCSLAHGKKTFNKENLQHFTSPILAPTTSGRLFDLLEGPLPHTHQQNKGQSKRTSPSHQQQHQLHDINLHHFAAHLATLLRGDVPGLAHSCLLLASAHATSVTGQELVKFVISILQSYEKLLNAHCTAYQSWIFASPGDSYMRLAGSLLSPLLQPEKTTSEISEVPRTGGKTSFSEDDVATWLSMCPIFTQVLSQVFHGAFQFYQTEPQQMTFQPRIPQVRDTNWSKFRTILDFPTALFLNFALLSELQTEWKLLFSSNLHGNSFSQLLQYIRGKGPTYVIVRDKDDHVFGGFAAVPWDLNPKFVGNSSCFLLRIKPDYCIYKPTGYNENYMYLNHQVQTLPNGLGMGGQFEFFGLWIDQSFDRGHSKASARGCTTYGSPRLSAKEEFQVDTIEVWAVGKKKKENDDDEEEEQEASNKTSKKSILDKMDTADKAILDMVDRGTISDAIREVPFVEETKAHNTIISPF